MNLTPARLIITAIFCFCIVSSQLALAAFQGPLQLFIQLTPKDGTLKLKPGTYSGPANITRPIHIEAEGGGEVIIDGQFSGSVITLKTNNSSIRGLTIINSGLSFDQVDAGINVTGDNNVVEENTIKNTLFGIHLTAANDNRVVHNYVSSIDAKSGLRGEGLRLWNSHDNQISHNTFYKIRDIFITNSENNLISHNKISHSRVGVQLIFSHENRLQYNHISYNSTGLLLLYSNDLLIEQNTITHLRSFSGSAMAFKESVGVVAKNNHILHCAVGINANTPVHPENIIRMENNRLAYNDVAMYFYGEKGGHEIFGNLFEKNLIDVQVSNPRTARHNHWLGNFWDTYQGFDRDLDGVGDTPFELYSYSDRIWRDRPMTQFFRGSPLMEAIDFAERLTSFSPPRLILRDPKPSFLTD